MVIGNPITTVPKGGRAHGRSKYEPAFEAAVAARGAWVPITFADDKSAQLFFNAAKQFTQRPGTYHGLECTRRAKVVYVRMPLMQAVGVR